MEHALDLPRATAHPREAGAPAAVVITMLLVAIFTPYGLLPVAGGSLRLDHLLIPAITAFTFACGWLRWPPVLAVGLLVHMLLALLGTLFFAEYADRNLLESAKNLDSLTRGIWTLLVASSLAATPAATRRMLWCWTWIAVVFFLMALVDRFAADTWISQRLVDLYGGAKYTVGAWGAMGVNHKGLMLLVERASAVFVTAPALAMAAAFLMNLGLSPGMPIPRGQRRLLLFAAFGAGVLSNSKSFLLALPILFILNITASRARRLVFPTTVTLLLLAVGVPYLYSRLVERFGVDGVLIFKIFRSVYDLTGGRLGGEEWSILDVTYHVLANAPALGYGLGRQPNLAYSDSGLNFILLQGGMIALLAVTIGVALQLFWFLQVREVSPWGRFGFSTLVLSLSFFIAGPIFSMPRINDLLFSMIGVSIAVTRHAVRSRSEGPGGTSGADPVTDVDSSEAGGGAWPTV